MLSKALLNKFWGDFDVEEGIKGMKQKTDESFYLCNLSDVIKKFDDWMSKLPRVKPFYAVKCNDDIGVLQTLASIGCSFDCASLGEIAKILSINVEPSRIIFANTTKLSTHIEFAKKFNVNLMTFDNEDELDKIVKHFPKADLVLRIRYCSEKAKHKLGKKFGCDPFAEAPMLLELAQSLGLNVVGVSFHIGSSCEDYDAYCGAIKVSREIFEVAESFGFKMNILDLGGGFPGDSFTRIDEFSEKINESLDESFPSDEFPYLKIFAEPGRYFVESAFTLAASIHSRKISRDEDGQIRNVMYYLNEGVYSNFMDVLLGPEFFEPKIFSDKKSDTKFDTTLWGPTCDSTDVVCRDIQMELLNIGDTIYFTNMGAYTIVLGTNFNSFTKTKVWYFLSFNDWFRLAVSLFDSSNIVIKGCEDQLVYAN